MSWQREKAATASNPEHTSAVVPAWRRRDHLVTIMLGAIGSLVAVLFLSLMTTLRERPLLWLIPIAIVAVTGFAVLFSISVRRERRVLALLRDVRLGQEAAVQELQGRAERLTLATATTTRTPSLLLGVDVGRSVINYGTLQLPQVRTLGMPGQAGFGNAAEIRGPIGPDVYVRIGRAISKTADVLGRLDGIGVGLPGQVDVTDGRLVNSPAGMGYGENFRDELINRIIADSSLLDVLVEDAKRPSAVLFYELSEKIHVDNDATCAVRGLLNLHKDEAAWRNFACVLIGTGVGAGLVFNREVYNGSDGAAGEVGHMILSPQKVSAGHGSRAADQFLECACGHARGTGHWEALVGGPALARLVQLLEPALREKLEGEYGRPLTGQDLGLIASALAGHGRGDLTEALQSVANESRDNIRKVLDLHAKYLAMGIANLVNCLNLDHLVLGGGVMDGLIRLADYHRLVYEHLSGYLLEIPGRRLDWLIDYEGGRSGFAWQGAALLFVDPSYYDRLDKKS